MRHGDFAVLVAALLFVGHLVFDLQRAGARLDHFLGEQIGRLGIAEARIDVGDDRHDMGLKIVDRRQQRLVPWRCLPLCGRRRWRGICRRVRGHPPGAGRRKSLRSAPAPPSSRASTGPASGPNSERSAATIQPDRYIYRRSVVPKCFLMEIICCWRDKSMPAAERLGVKGGIGVIGRHVLAHDGGRISGDIETRLEAVLQAHPGHGLGVDAVPCAVLALDELHQLANMALIFVGLRDLALIVHRARLVWPAKLTALLISFSTRSIHRD